jgi:hypothetical protein
MAMRRFFFFSPVRLLVVLFVLMVALASLSFCTKQPRGRWEKRQEEGFSFSQLAFDSNQGIRLRVLSFNVRGLPVVPAEENAGLIIKMFHSARHQYPSINAVYESARRVIPAETTFLSLGSLIQGSSYDAVFLQETWCWKPFLLKHISRFPFIGEGRSNDLTIASSFFFTLSYLLKEAGSCDGFLSSGLTTLVALPGTTTALPYEPFSSCSGYLEGKNDCFSEKGDQRIRHTFPNDAELDLVNVHMDAASGLEDLAAREKQSEEIERGLEDSGAVIVVGDFNHCFGGEEEPPSQLIESFPARNGLTNANARNGNRTRPCADSIFFRGSDKIDIELLRAGVDRNFEGKSDHPAIFAEFHILFKGSR